MSVINVKTSEFEKEVLQSEKPVLVDFWASWCGPCKALAPVIDEIAAERSDIKVCKVDVDAEPSLASRYGIMGVPTLALVRDGQVVQQTAGVKPKAQILAMLEKST